MNAQELKPVLEALIMVTDTPLSLERLTKLIEDEADGGRSPSREVVRTAVAELQQDYVARGVELVEVASGFRFQARATYSDRVSRLWEERKPRYSRAQLETLALIAYRQPITRGEIEHVRGVAVSSNIMRLLLEREWVRVVGHRDVPGRPAVYATTNEFLDYFGLKSLAELPTLADLKDFDAVNADLFAPALSATDELDDGGTPAAGAAVDEAAAATGTAAAPIVADATDADTADTTSVPDVTDTCADGDAVMAAVPAPIDAGSVAVLDPPAQVAAEVVAGADLAAP